MNRCFYSVFMIQNDYAQSWMAIKSNAGFLLFNSGRRWCTHSKWDLVGYSGGSSGLENAVKRWGRPIGPICSSVYFDARL